MKSKRAVKDVGANRGEIGHSRQDARRRNAVQQEAVWITTGRRVVEEGQKRSDGCVAAAAAKGIGQVCTGLCDRMSKTGPTELSCD